MVNTSSAKSSATITGLRLSDKTVSVISGFMGFPLSGNFQTASIKIVIQQPFAVFGIAGKYQTAAIDNVETSLAVAGNLKHKFKMIMHQQAAFGIFANARLAERRITAELMAVVVFGADVVVIAQAVCFVVIIFKVADFI